MCIALAPTTATYTGAAGASFKFGCCFGGHCGGLLSNVVDIGLLGSVVAVATAVAKIVASAKIEAAADVVATSPSGGDTSTFGPATRAICSQRPNLFRNR